MNSQLAGTLFTEELYRIEKKNFVVIAEPWVAFGPSDRELLQKILQAVGQSIDSVIISYQPTFSISTIHQQALRVICFGLAVPGVEQFAVTTIEETPVIFSPTLKQLQTDSGAKQKFWSGLKVLFSQ